jgi:hypothetical protein
MSREKCPFKTADAFSLQLTLRRTAYRCEKEPTGELNRESLINCINEIALNTPDK